MYQLRIKRFLSLATALLILSGCGVQKKLVLRDVQFSSAQSGVVKVMTFNIRVGSAFWDTGNCWGNRKQIVVDTIIDNAADVIGLQEALDFQVEHIQQALPKYARYAIGRNNGKRKGETCAIFYRKDRFELSDCGTFWFSNNPEKPGSKRWGNLFPRICTWVRLVDKADAISFYVYNLHLDHLSQNSRNKSVRLLASRIAARKTQDPFIIMGDFNMELKNPAMMYLNKVGYQSPCSAMKNAWLSVNNEKKNIGTRHNFLGGTKGPKIDHIEISENTQALNVKIDRYAVNGRYPSDHFPVIATVRIPMKKAVSMERWNQNFSNL